VFTLVSIPYTDMCCLTFPRLLIPSPSAIPRSAPTPHGGCQLSLPKEHRIHMD
jgi:hypothetical protein